MRAGGLMNAVTAMRPAAAAKTEYRVMTAQMVRKETLLLRAASALRCRGLEQRTRGLPQQPLGVGWNQVVAELADDVISAPQIQCAGARIERRDAEKDVRRHGENPLLGEIE